MIYILNILDQQDIDFISNTQFLNVFLREQCLKGKCFRGSNFLKGENFEIHFLREQFLKRHEFFEGANFLHNLYI